MNFEYAKNPQWSNLNHTMIDLVIKWNKFPNELSFTASPNDCEEHGRLIYEAAINGEYGLIKEYVPPPEITPQSPEEKLQASGLTIEELKKLLNLN